MMDIQEREYRVAVLNVRLLLFIFVSSNLAFAAAPPDIHKLRADFQSTKRSIERAEVKQRAVLSGLYQINKRIKKTVTEKGELTQQKAFLEINIRSLEQKILDLEQKYREQRTLLAHRLSAIYKLGGASISRMMFSSKSAVSLDKNLKILGIIAAHDLEMIKNYSKDIRELESKKNMLAQRVQNLQALIGKISLKEIKLSREQELKSKILDNIRKTKMFALKEIDGLREKSLQFNLDDSGVFDNLYKPSFADRKGELPSPIVAGKVIQKFGLIKGEDQPYTVSNKGVLFHAEKGSPIQSIFEGRVSFVGEIPGFGSTLIIDHGDHYYSVYSHTQKILVQLGSEIAQSQVIAHVGDGPEREPGLYFEIRHFSEPYDPQQWMKGL